MTPAARAGHPGARLAYAGGYGDTCACGDRPCDAHRIDLTPAARAAESIRQLNHDTIDPGTVDTAVLYDTLGELARLTAMLPQALAQLDRGVAWAFSRGLLAVDGDATHGVAATALGIGVNIDTARRSLERVSAAIDRAHELASNLYQPTPAVTS